MAVSKDKKDKYKLVMQELLTILESGAKPWSRGWVQTPYCNAFSGHRYTGINPVLAEISLMARGYKSTLFVGFRQAKDMGLRMKKGSKATQLRLGGRGTNKKVDPDTGETVKTSYGFRSWINVFNIDCFTDENAKVKIPDLIERYQGKPSDEPRIAEAELLIKAQKAKIVVGGNRACYSPNLDQIHMPPYESFSSPESYYATLIHELSHRTGHKSRLNRDLLGNDSSKEYAFEELIADMSAAFVCSVLNIDSCLENHASYLASWMSLISDDKKAFFRAYKLAQSAADLLLENAGINVDLVVTD